MRLLTAGLLLVAPLCAAFYLPGLAPVSFCEEGEESEGCKVRALTGGPDTGGSPPRPRRGFRGEGGGEEPPSIPQPPRCGPRAVSLRRQPLLREAGRPLLPFPLPHLMFLLRRNLPFSSQRREGPSPLLGSVLHSLPWRRRCRGRAAPAWAGGRGLSQVCGNSAVA